MKVLLDTHAFVWFVEDPERIPQPTFDMLEDPNTEMVISALTPWEIATKTRLGKIELEGLVLAFDETVARLRATLLDFTSAHAIAAGSLTWEHRDPFDRGLAAQSILEHMPLVTGDRALAALPGLRVVW